MKITTPKEGLEINKRFFLALAKLKEEKIIRGMHTFTKRYGLNYRNILWLRDEPEGRRLPPEYLVYLVRDYGISPYWLLLGKGEIFDVNNNFSPKIFTNTSQKV